MEASATTRLKLTVQYDGSAFRGWQLQPDERTVQGELEAALSRLADRPIRVLASGRTDTGVHATGQVATADMPTAWTPSKLQRALNALLPGDAWIAGVEEVSDHFHPRYDALARTYTYEVGLRPESASPFHRRWCWPLREELDRSLLEAAAAEIVGAHSFRAFSKSGQPERGERCTVSTARWEETALGVELSITADRYLHHMVRYLVGTMVDMARGHRPLADMARLLANDSSVTTSPPAPPQGLFLRSVRYGNGAGLEERPESPQRRSTARA